MITTIKFKRRLVALFIGIILVSSAISGCNTKIEEGETSSINVSNKTNDGIITLRFATIDSPGETLIFQEFQKGFEAENENIKIKYEALSGDYSGKLLAQASAGSLPDVFMNLDVLVANFAKKKVTLPLDQYMDKYKIDKSDFYPSMLGLGAVDGKQHMMPRDYSHVVTYYNKKLFDESGVPYPKNGWTWNEFKETSRKLVKKTNGKVTQFGTMVQMNWPASMVPMITGLGGTILNNDGTAAELDNASTISAFEELKQLADDGVIVNNFMVGLPDFLSKKVGMYFSVRPGNTNIDAALGKGNWDVVTFPIMPKKHVVGSGTSGYSVAASTRYPDEAARLVMYIVSDAGQQLFMKTGNAIPVRKSFANSDIWRSLPSKDHNQDAYILYPEADILPITSMLKDGSKGTKFLDNFNRMCESIFLGQETIEQGLKNGQININGSLK